MSLSGWCSTHGRRQCKWCRSLVCSCEACGHPWRKANPAQPRPDVRDSGGSLRENWGTSKDGPGDSLRQQRAEVPGPRRTAKEFD